MRVCSWTGYLRMDISRGSFFLFWPAIKHKLFFWFFFFFFFFFFFLIQNICYFFFFFFNNMHASFGLLIKVSFFFKKKILDLTLILLYTQIFWIILRRNWNGILDKFRWETLQELLYDSSLTWSGCYLRNCCKKISFVIVTIFVICMILCKIQFTFFL